MKTEQIRRMAYWIWRGLPPHYDLDDITSEAILGALQAREGCEVIAAKRQIIAYLRRCNPGSRGTRRMCLKTVWWEPSGGPTQERSIIAEEMRQRVLRAVDTLTAKELAVIRSCFWDETPQGEAARIMGTTEAYYSRLKGKALRKLRMAVAV